MIPAFVEAMRATAQPCTLLVLLPAALMAVITHGRWRAFASICVGAVLGGWLFVANVVSLSDAQLQVSGLMVGAAIVLVLASPWVDRLAWVRGQRVQAGIAGGVTFVSTLWWRPCVGRELGAILTASRNGIGAQLPGVTAYMLGTMVPVLAVVLVMQAIDPSTRAAQRAALVAGTFGLVVAAALTVGRHDELVTTLTRWSQ